jgi:hypothetical protein
VSAAPVSATAIDVDAWEDGADRFDPERRGDPLAGALELAEAGLPVFRAWWTNANTCACPEGAACGSAGKHPLRKGWQQEATTDPDALMAAWALTPNASPAIATGRIAVLDLDVNKPGGDEALALCEARGIPETWTVQTQSGGRHFYFAADPRVSDLAVGIVAGLDIRDRGGLVVAPRALGAKGRYRFLHGGPGTAVPIAAQPEWLVRVRLGFKRLGQSGKAKTENPSHTVCEGFSASAPKAFRARGFPEGNRNRGLFEDGCAMVKRGLGAAEIERLLLASATLCTPPLPEHEARKIVESIRRRYL